MSNIMGTMRPTAKKYVVREKEKNAAFTWLHRYGHPSINTLSKDTFSTPEDFCFFEDIFISLPDPLEIFG